MKSKASFPDLSPAQNAEIDRARKLGWKVEVAGLYTQLPMSSRVLQAARDFLKTVQTEPPALPLPSGPDSWSNAIIAYCDSGVFFGDIIITPHAVTIIASKFKLDYNESALALAQWKIVNEFPGTYWNKSNGRFVLPRKAVTKLK